MELLGAPLDDDAVEARLAELARRHARAGHIGVEILNLLGGQAEDLLGRLPPQVRARLDDASERALRAAIDTAHRSRGVTGEAPGWMSRAVGTAMGAAGGFGGLPTAMAELPVTTTLLLRTIQDAAVDCGFDPGEAAVRHDCVQVFAAAGPLSRDDGTDLGFLAARLTVTGPTVQALIARVAPRLATVLGQKLAAQTVPVRGAAAGAATNDVYTRYYGEMGQVHFGLRRLAIDADRDHAQLVETFRRRLR